MEPSAAVEARAPDRRDRRLSAVLGFGFALAMVVGTILPVTFANSALTARHLPSLAPYLLAWLAGGLYACLGANAQAELATMVPESGGPYVYARRAYGPWGGFLVGWGDAIINICGMAAPTLLVGACLAELWPPAGRWSTGIAVVCVVALAAVNAAGIRAGDRVQKLAAAFWGAVLVLFVAVAFASSARPAATAAHDAPAALSWVAFAGAFMAAQRLILFSYSGWNMPVYLAEEHVDPSRQLPRGMFGGIALSVGAYLVVNAALARVLSMEGLARAPLPLVAAARAAGGPAAAVAIVAFSAASLALGLNSGLLAVPRTLYAIARDGLFARSATGVNAGGTPAVALWLVTAAVVGFIVSGTYDELLEVFAGVAVANDMLVAAAVIVLRVREPSLARPWRAWGYPWTILALIAGDAALGVSILASRPAQAAWALGLLLASVPLYLVLRRRAPAEARRE